MGQKIDGKKIAQKYRAEIKSFVEARMETKQRIPCVATILVGNDGGSLYYVNNKNKLCSELGILAKDVILAENITEEELISHIQVFNEDSTVDGIILQLPLPKHLNEKQITSHISYEKDVDGLTDMNMGKFYKGEKSFVPCTPKGVMELIKSTGIKIEGKHAVVIGRSNIVGKPVAQLLLNENATVTICHSKSANMKEICRSADILISAIGKPGFVTAEFVKEGAVVIDVGTTMVGDQLKGDLCFEEVLSKAAFVTPVPGGVGAMTTTMLIKNTCEALK